MKKLLVVVFCCCILLVGCSKDNDKTSGTGNAGNAGTGQQSGNVGGSTVLPKPDALDFELNGNDPNFQEGGNITPGNRVDLSNVPDYTVQEEGGGTDAVQTGDGEEDGNDDATEGDGKDNPSAAKPTSDTKYPNTGIFLEDD